MGMYVRMRTLTHWKSRPCVFDQNPVVHGRKITFREKRSVFHQHQFSVKKDTGSRFPVHASHLPWAYPMRRFLAAKAMSRRRRIDDLISVDVYGGGDDDNDDDKKEEEAEAEEAEEELRTKTY